MFKPLSQKTLNLLFYLARERQRCDETLSVGESRGVVFILPATVTKKGSQISYSMTDF